MTKASPYKTYAENLDSLKIRNISILPVAHEVYNAGCAFLENDARNSHLDWLRVAPRCRENVVSEYERHEDVYAVENQIW